MPPVTARSPGRALATPRTSVPADSVVPPVKVFAAESVTEPAVAFESAPPVSVAETVPLLSVTLARSTEPPVSVPPESVKVFASARAFRSNVPPETVIALVPKASTLEPLSVPAETFVAPEKPVFAPETVSVPPTPLIVSEPEPPISAPSETAEVAVTLIAVALSTPVVPVRLPEENVTVPVVWSKAPRVSVPPPTVKALAEPSWLATPNARVPALTVVVPEYENVPAASSVRVPAPDLVRPPTPETVPESVPVVAPRERLEPAPLRLTVPLFARLLTVSVPPIESVAPEATVRSDVVGSRPFPVVASVPAETLVAPP